MENRPCRILLIEDDPGDAYLIKTYLADQSHLVGEVRHENTFEEGLERLAHESPDVVLLDLFLPDVDGLEAASRLRGEFPDIPIVLLTGLDDEAVASGALANGAQDYLVKGDVSGRLLARSIRYAIDRQAAERELRASEERYRRITESVTDYIYHVDFENGQPARTVHSPACVAVTGYTSEDFARAPFLWLTMVPSEDHEALKEHVSRIGRGEPVPPLVHRIVRKDGQIRWVRNTPVVHADPSGEIGGYDGLISDITETKRAGDERQRLVAAIDQVAESILITDRESIIQYVNPAFESITGYSRDEAIGRPASLLKSDRHEPPFYHRLWERLLSGQSWQGRMTNRRKDGTLFDEDKTITPVFGPNRQIVNFVSVGRDITRELEMEEKLRQSQKMEAIGQLAGGVAHDFNNQLAAILGYAEMMQPEVAGRADLSRYVDTIIETAGRASNLIEQLLSFARKGKARSTAIETPPLIDKVIDLLSRTLDRSIRVERDYAGGALSIVGDPTQIQNALLNLGVNARDAMPEGGTLIFRARRVELEESYCNALSQNAVTNPYIEISVRDTGIGMDEGTRERIFEPFFTTKPQDKGTGLGLASVYGAVRSHRGRIEVESAPGEGTEFRIHLPVPVEEKGPTRLEVPRELQPIRGRGRILVVDDEEPLRAFLGEMLEKLGYEVETASDGREALAYLAGKADETDLVILDMNMPGLGGGKTLQRIQERHPATKVLISTGYAEELQGIIEQGICVIRKPYTHFKLSEAVDQTLRGTCAPTATTAQAR
jgi:two-component system, cell cycle sensor histidine kinase and response regulator CckA